jgi:uncharacterized membrane protein
MNVNFQYSKTLAIEGSILLWLTAVPYVGWVLGIVGIVLLLRGMKELSNFYQDEKIYQGFLSGIKFYVIGVIAEGVAVASAVLALWSATGFKESFTLTTGFEAGIIAFAASAIVAFVFFLLAAPHFKRTFNTLAQKSGEQSFETAGVLFWIGSILTIIGVGFLLIFIAWIFATIGFFTMKPPQYQQYSPQTNGASPTFTQPEHNSTEPT